MADQWYTYGTVAVYDAAPGASDKLVTNLTGGKFVLVKDGPAQPIRDLNGTPISEITSNADGQSSQFQSQTRRGLVQFGDLAVTVWGLEVADELDNVSAAVAAAQDAVAAAQQAVQDAQAALAAAQAVGVDIPVLFANPVFREAFQDLVADEFATTQGTGVAVAYNDSTGKLTVTVAAGGAGGLDTEGAQDVFGLMVQQAGGTYNDVAGTVTFPSGGTFDAEAVRDAIAAAASGSGYVTVTANDTADTIVFSGSTTLTTALAAKVDTTDARLSDARTPTDNSVTAAKIVDGSVGTAELATDSVTAAKIAAGAVGASEIADGAVGTAELADGAVTRTKINGFIIAGARSAADPILTDAQALALYGEGAFFTVDPA